MLRCTGPRTADKFANPRPHFMSGDRALRTVGDLLSDESMFSGLHADAAAALVDAASTEEWGPALNLVERAFGVRGVILMGYENFARHPVAVLASSAGMRPDRQQDYLENFAAIDVRAAFCAVQPHGQIIHDHQMGAIEEVDRTPLYAEFLLPLDIGRFVGVNLGLGQRTDARSHTYFAMAKANDSGPPTAEEAAQVLGMGQLARSAVRTAGIVSALRARSRRMRAAIEQLDIGVVFLEPGCVVTDCNDAARKLFSENSAVKVERRRLSFVDGEADAKLKKLMRSDIALQPGDMWTARRESGGGALVVVAAHIDYEMIELNGPVVTLFLIDSQRQTRTGKAAWIRLFNLTPSESDVAELMVRGLSRREIAERRGVSEGTVHVQMRALYAKLHVSKLNDALLLLSATSGG